ncbi:S8 family serine peptidase [Pseudokineococcus lusitanus]|uniref:S8 family serine peptidase n=1 Tax=Pseudokineococcus lusitanus TaxID=763993 RepID=UPI001319E979|nr:S8 family serine peptidase [Pseudokineococcus lusitanus]
MTPRPAPQARRRRALAAVAGFGLLAASVGTAAGTATASPAPADAPLVADLTTTKAQSTDPADYADGRYVVTMVEKPAAVYEGGTAGLAATAPEEGQSLATASAPVRAYTAHLEEQQEQAADAVDAEVEESFSAALNGFVADLTAEQAAELAAAKDVLAVTPDEDRAVDTIHSPEFLGLSGEDGLWEELGGTAESGKGVVVGVIDTGMTPDHPSFAGAPVTSTEPSDEVGATWLDADGNIAVRKADGDVYTALCDTGPRFSADQCNSKLVSAQHFSDGFAANVAQKDWTSEEELSPYDADGHGSHTAGTAAGNLDVPAVVDGSEYGLASGMAPAAKVAVYKVCHSSSLPNVGGCFTTDSVAAIDQAVLDGVDVLNFSISGSTTTSLDPVELAFMSAAASGVFVAASAGNSGPGVSTVAHNSPWLTTVAASTHFNYYGTVELGNGELYRGSSVSETGLPQQTPLRLATAVAVATPPTGLSAVLCQPGTLDPAEVAGSVVVCDRGVNARTEKSEVVRDAGGVGMVLANTSPSSLDSDVHVIPTVHVDEVAGAAIKAYAATEGATTALLPGDQTDLAPLATPVVAGFSSRGPALAHAGDLLKPDISAPGVGVLAASAPGSNSGRSFNFLSGTSMSSPHVAGLAALIMGEKPEWSPMAVKSAMMTTAYDLKNDDGSTDRSRFTQGAGHVDPTRFLEPGLVYESDLDDWLSFLEGSSGQDLVDGVEPIDPTQLNGPSIAVGELLGGETVTRTVTATTPGIYRASVDMPGFTTRVTPPVLNFTQAGQSKTFQVRVVRTTAPADAYSAGSLTWTGRGGVSARIPVAARPVSASVPADVTGSVEAGSTTFSVSPGQTAPVAMTVQHGFTPGQRDSGTLARGGEDFVKQVVVPAGGAQHMRADLVAGEGSVDLDLFLETADGSRVLAQSATGSADERIDVRNVPAGTYRLVVDGYDVAATGGDFRLDTFLLNGPTGNATLSPNPVQGPVGRAVPVTISYTGLAADVPHLAVVGYAGTQRRTFVTVD